MESTSALQRAELKKGAYQMVRYYGMKLFIEHYKKYGPNLFRIKADPIRPLVASVKNGPRVIHNVLWKCMAIARGSDPARYMNGNTIVYNKFWPKNNSDFMIELLVLGQK